MDGRAAVGGSINRCSHHESGCGNSSKKLKKEASYGSAHLSCQYSGGRSRQVSESSRPIAKAA